MQARDFVFWLNGLFEIGGDKIKSLDEAQVAIIKTHLALVFEHDRSVKQGVGTHPAPMGAHTNPLDTRVSRPLTRSSIFGDDPASAPLVIC